MALIRLSVLVCPVAKMPKAKLSNSARLRGFIQDLGEKYFSTDGKILLCKLYEISVMAAKRYCVQQRG